VTAIQLATDGGFEKVVGMLEAGPTKTSLFPAASPFPHSPTPPVPHSPTPALPALDRMDAGRCWRTFTWGYPCSHADRVPRSRWGSRRSSFPRANGSGWRGRRPGDVSEMLARDLAWVHGWLQEMPLAYKCIFRFPVCQVSAANATEIKFAARNVLPGSGEARASRSVRSPCVRTLIVRLNGRGQRTPLPCKKIEYSSTREIRSPRSKNPTGAARREVCSPPPRAGGRQARVL